ncbi:hypothetical protein [Bacillus changyiensis]|uniref:hypothetical protein n=1 Tax=Bacillus changyiensis TaxID=3004103 RepID=UPI0022E412A1|nr:hypothetical protein [Bacillus changyiensis]MDA1476120.1 hypothetical protein [Bacillus changyiensis]
MKRNQLKINGSGSAAGGVYENVLISGEGTIGGGLDCLKFRTYGTSSLTGDAIVQAFHIHGETKVGGSLKADKIKIYGKTDIVGDVHTGEAVVRGAINIGGHLSAERCDIKGALTGKGNCEAESFELTGSVELDGLLNAGVIEIGLRFDKSSVKEIGGTVINVKNKRGLFKPNGGFLSTETIEGDDIYLENTSAQIVRGNRIHIGPSCQIKTVEYKTELTVSKRANVGEKKRI